MITEYPRGSEWRRWDLHVHTPASYLSNEYGDPNLETTWDNYVKELFSKALQAEICAIGITDYFSIEGYEKIIEYRSNKAKLQELGFSEDDIKKIDRILLLPNIELRLKCLVGTNRVNYHIIFSNDVPVREIKENFLENLYISYEGNPDSADYKFKLNKNNLQRLGEKLIREHQGFSGNSTLFVGAMNAVVDDNEISRILSTTKPFSDSYITIIPVDEDLSRLSWDGQDHQIRKILYQKAHCFFSSNQGTIDFGLGLKHANKKKYLEEFKTYKPCVHGSDAHSYDKIFNPDENRYCWIKADPTFNGLKQILYEPEERVKILESKPEVKENYYVIDRVEIHEDGFPTNPIYFNDKLTCIIGGKSTGKSILLQNVATHIDEEEALSNLRISNFQTVKNLYKIDMHVFWADGEEKNRKIIYIPQTYLNKLCDNEEEKTIIDRWIQDILFLRPEIKDAYERCISTINTLTIQIETKIMNFIKANGECCENINSQKEIGDKDAVITNLGSLLGIKSELSKNLNISEDDINSYPVMVEKIFSSKTNKSYLKVAPVFLFPVEYNAGEINVSSIPSINKEVIKQYSTQNSEDNLIYEIIELEKQLGLDIVDNDVELDDLISRLQQLRQWAWKEEMDPESLTNETPIQDINTEGIYNRAIIIATEKSPFTLGLENELSELSKLDENEYKGTALYDWINLSSSVGNIQEEISDNILEVLPLNSEQEQAVRTSLSSNVTIVTGPPGTGKSQVVTDLLVNAIWKGQNVLFTSKNNKAVDVVESRLNNLSTRPVMLRISATQNNTNILSVINTLLSTTVNIQDKVDYENLSKIYFEEVNVYESLRNKKEACVALRNKIDQLEQRICAFREQWQKYYHDITSKQIDNFNACFNVVSRCLYKTIKEKQNWLIKIFWPILFKARKNKFINAIASFNIMAENYGIKQIPENLNEVILKEYSLEFKDCISNMYSIIEYQDLLSTLATMETLENIDRKLWNHKNSLAKKSTILWDKWLLARPINISPAERQNMSRFVSALKLQQGKNIGNDQKFAKELTNMHKLVAKFLPCWAVTSLSAKGRIPFSPAIYDVLVIDEASQCDIASMLPLLYRTKRVVIIGDNKQLPHISSISKKQDVNLLQKYNVDYEWTYSSNSIFDLASIVNTPSSLVNLLDHHRSFADIIEFSNKEFYEGKLRVATDYRKLKLPKNEIAGVRWIDIKGKVLKPYNGGAFNNAEIKQIIEELNRLVIQNDYQGSIGIVTPFRAQADKIRDAIEKLPELKNRLYAKNDFLVDTVHKFQGDERDIIIFSSVISQNTPFGAIIFLKNTGNLFNVAITRARSILIVVGDMDYCAHCNVPYMEHFVEYTNTLGNKILPSDTTIFYPETRDYPAVQNIEQVSEWEKYLYTKLFDAGIATSPQYPVDKYKLDLAIIINDKKKLDIEVDGEMYHRNWNGELCYRDQLRNQRLFELGWDVKRFWVYQIRDQLPWCIEQIRKWLQ